MLERIINYVIRKFCKDENISDGYHTFDELYEHRIRLFIALCSSLRYQEVWVSKKHHDGTSMEGWFIMGIGAAKGKQISYHLPEKYLKECTARFALHEHAPYKWDGHTSEDVLKRLKYLQY